MRLTKKDLKEMVGNTEDEAIKKIKNAGMIFRVVQRDEETFILTTDFLKNRVSLSIKMGKIIDAKIG